VALLGQERAALAADPSPLATAVRRRTGLTESDARTALAAFGLGAGHATRPRSITSRPGDDLVRAPADAFVEEFVGADKAIARLRRLERLRGG
jgi:hypothetical protein